jgi:hypothetical protein
MENQMNNRLNEFATEAGMSVEYLTNTKQIVCLEKFAELIVTHCASLCMAKADRKNILNAYNLLTEGDVKYPAPDPQGHHTQYGRKYDTP